MKLECYLLEGAEIDIHPAPRRRRWMDETPGAYAYRCLPLSIANAHGWEIRCSGSFEAEWNGGGRPEDIQVWPGGDGPCEAHSRFGSGVLTIPGHAVFRTPPGFNLWVTGPVNAFKDGIQALSAVVETDWLPFPFTMNWKFTRPALRVAFAKGEPFCFLFPVPRDLLEGFDPELKPISEDPSLEAQYRYAHNRRTFLEALRHLQPQEVEGLDPQHLQQLQWQKWYIRGEWPDRSGMISGHRTSLEVKPFMPAAAGEKGR